MSRVRAGVDPSKLELIKQGKKKVNETGVKENKKTISNKDGQFVAIEKERKFEEAGVTKKKEISLCMNQNLGQKKMLIY
jgi:hypothetical protein